MTNETAKPKTCQGADGQQYTIPENPDPCRDLTDALRDHLSPEACAAIAADLTPDTKEPGVNEQVLWFKGKLIEMLGIAGYNRALEEIGY